MKYLVILSALLFVQITFAKGDAAKGKAKAVTCFACHGPKGISSNELWPNLAGQKEAYLAKQIRAFKTGARKDPLMNSQVQMLSETDIDNVAAFFARMK